MPKLKRFFALLLIISFSCSFISPPKSLAQITECDILTTPNQVASGSTNDFTFNVTNGSAARIHWLKFTRPSANFTLGSALAFGWTIATAPEAITLSGGSLNSFVSRDFILTGVVAANVNAPSANWTVEASDSSSGTNPLACIGSMTTTIGTPDVTAPVISSITTSNLTSSSATISWTTNEPSTSTVNYGLTSGYGNNASDGILLTSHSLDLSGLSANTGYHYQVVSSDASNNTASSSDNTFLTAANPSNPSGNTGNQSNTQSNNNQPSQVTPKKTATGDSTVPVVTITTNLNAVFKDAPLIKGVATDNVAVTAVDYSLDGGNNWLTADSTSTLGQKEVNFEFKAVNLPDDNYTVIVRAIDSSDNFGFSTSAVLIIDQMPPLLGPSVISFGPQLVDPSNGVTTAVKGLDEKITLSAKGGPTSIVIRASAKDRNETRLFSLTKSNDTGLWSGILSFEKAGTYSLVATAIDGAKNKVERQLNTVFVDKPSTVLNSKDQKPLNSAKVTLYYFDKLTSSWVLWDADSFGQKNPQPTNSNGEFKLFVPPGEYYMQAEAKGFKTLKSDIFTLEKGTSLSTSIEMKPTWNISLGKFSFNFPDIFFNSFKVNTTNNLPASSAQNNFEGKDLPSFSLPSTSRNMVNSLDLTGKPTVLVFVSTWSPSTEGLINQLQSLPRDEFNVSVIFELDSLEKVKAYKRIAAYDLDFLADSQGELLSKLGIQSLPTEVFISRAGVIAKVASSVLSKEELQTSLTKL